MTMKIMAFKMECPSHLVSI